MSKLRCQISISLDGFVAGPNQSEEHPLGEGGERLHERVVRLAVWRQSHGAQGGEVNESTRIVEELVENVGAGVMGRNMFGPVGGGPWGDEQWTGWWGANPPYHNPVFIVTHYPRDKYLAAGLLDELELHVAPVLLGDGVRLLDNLGDTEVQLEQVRAVEAPGVTHLKYRLKNR